MGRDPYGFIGRFQALTCAWSDASLEIAKLLINRPRMLDAYIAALPSCGSFEQGNTQARLFPYIDSLSDEQARKLIAVFNSNHELKYSFGFNGRNADTQGGGLPDLLKRTTGKRVVFTASDELEFAAASL
jgi:hypothetical protein